MNNKTENVRLTENEKKNKKNGSDDTRITNEKLKLQHKNQ